jgi:16S rRNA (cytosine967-C5)-methyltransferase
VAAYEVTAALSGGHADLAHAVPAARAALQDERDRALAAEIAIGVQRRRLSLDYLIAHFARRPIERLDPEILDVLRISCYQLLYLTRVPASAVVDDAVTLAGQLRKRSARGLVNAVLRAVSRARLKLPLPARPATPTDEPAALDYLSITLSHPRWFAARLYRRYGFEATELWLRFNNTPAPLTLRVNPLRNNRAVLIERLAKEQVSVRPARWAPDALIVESGNPLRGPGLGQGWFVVQSEASQLVARLAVPHSGQRVLDACASPGGKATAFAAAMRGEGLVVACDVRRSRLELLCRTVVASGAPNVRIVQADLRHPPPFLHPFDWVFVDAPCSGLGTLRRDPDIRWRRNEDDLLALGETQILMLRQAAQAVAPRGMLIYATCSSEREENESIVQAFLAEALDFEPVNLNTADHQVAADLINRRGDFETLPHVHELEAFFGAVFRRRG